MSAGQGDRRGERRAGRHAERHWDDVVAGVVAWHNRHPLARRITAAHVVSVGVVSFPFRAPPVDAAAAAAAERPHAAALQAAAPGKVESSERTDGDAQAPAAATETTAATGDFAAPAGARPTEGSVAGPVEGSIASGSLRERAEARARARGDAGATAPAAASARQEGPGRAATRTTAAQRRHWRAAFNENLLDPYPPEALARFALRHGSDERPGPADAPEREVEVNGFRERTRPRGDAIVRLWVHAVAIDLGARRVRVLVAPRGPRAVLGPRLIGRGRASAAGAFCGGVLAAAAAVGIGMGLLRPERAPGATAAVAVASAAAAAGSAPAGAAVGSAPAGAAVGSAPAGAAVGSAPAGAFASAPARAAVASVTARAAVAASAPAAAAAERAIAAAFAAAAAPAPASAGPPRARASSAPGGEAREPTTADLRRPPVAHVVPFLNDNARRAARELGDFARAERARQLAVVSTAAPQPSSQPPSTAAAQAAPRAAGAAVLPPSATAAATAGAAARADAPRATAWAVSTRRLRTRFESEQMLAALRDAAYRSGHGSELKLEVMPAGEDWRAVGWPLPTRSEAERLREALAARGLKAEVVQF